MTKKSGQDHTQNALSMLRTPNINAQPPGAPTNTGEAAAGTTTIAVNNMIWRPTNVPIAKTDNNPREGFLEKFTERQERFVSEARKWCVGPMPVNKFIQAFFPADQEGREAKCKVKEKERMPTSRNAFKSVPETPNNEQEMYGPLVSCLCLY